jgi:hypothetical protein
MAFWSAQLATKTMRRSGDGHPGNHTARALQINMQYSCGRTCWMKTGSPSAKLLAVDLGIGYLDAGTAISRGMEVSAAITASDTVAALAGGRRRRITI